MKTIVVFKLCKNPKDAMVSTDGQIDWGITKLSASDDDYRCTEIAKTLDGEIVGLTIGDGDIAWGAARGTSKTIHITDGGHMDDAARAAAVLAEAIRREGNVDLVLIGDSTWDPAVSVMLGAELGWKTLAGVTDVRPGDEGIFARRRMTVGEQEIALTLPAALGIMAQSEEGDPPSMKQVLFARKKPVDKITLEELGAETVSGLKVTGTKAPESAEATMLTGEDPAEIANKILDALRDEGVL